MFYTPSPSFPLFNSCTYVCGFCYLSCVFSAKTSCGSDQFECVEEKHCIPYVWRCDGDRDCQDGSDEPNDCNDSQYECKEGYFKCNSGR